MGGFENTSGAKSETGSETAKTPEVTVSETKISEVDGGEQLFGKEASEGMKLAKAQELAEETHKESCKQILEQNDKYLTPEGKERLEKGADSLEAVKPRPGDPNIGSFGFHEGTTRIQVAALDEAQVERTTRHETNHMASFNAETITADEMHPDLNHVDKASGIHRLSYSEASGQLLEFDDRYRGFNEGITQMYTIRQMEALDPEKGLEARRNDGYMFATELSEQVEEIVGPEVVAEAYYGGNLEALQAKIDAMAGPGAFERLSKDMDRVTYTDNYAERILAMQDAQEVLAQMYEGGAK